MIGDDELIQPTRPIEPRGCTLFDLLVIVFGCAAVWAEENVTSAANPVMMLLAIPITSPAIVWLVIVGRQFQYRRPLYAAEYVVAFVTAWMMTLLVPNVDTVLDRVSRYGLGQPLENWSLWRWSLAGFILSLASVSALLDWRAFPDWLRTSYGTLLGLGMLWGPIAVFERHFDLLRFVPVEAPLTVSDVVLIELQDALCRVPLLAAVFITIGASWYSFGHARKGWKWTCWFSWCLSLVVIVTMVCLFLAEAFGRTGLWHIGTAVELLTIVLLAGACLQVARAVLDRSEGNSRLAPSAADDPIASNTATHEHRDADDP